MANLSEQLRATADLIRAWDKYELSGPVPDKLDYALAANQMSEAASALDRLTVEGLAGVIVDAMPRALMADGQPFDAPLDCDYAKADAIAQALLTYITTPSVEESQ